MEMLRALRDVGLLSICWAGWPWLTILADGLVYLIGLVVDLADGWLAGLAPGWRAAWHTGLE